MSKWEDQVKVSLDDIFGGSDNKEETDKGKDPYANMSNDELNTTFIEANEDEYLEDLDDYYSKDEQVDLVSKGIHLTTAKEYHLETEKKPIWNNRITNKFKKWLEVKYPDRIELLNDKESRKDMKKSNNIINEQPKYKQELHWLYNFMENLNFGDFVPSDSDMIRIKNIHELVNSD